MSRYEYPPSLEAIIGDLHTRMRRVETSLTTIQVTHGTPTDKPSDGALRADATNTRLWVRVNGAYHFVGLT